jgi:formate dehydrogenase subunit delta
METKDMVRMANQIAGFFKGYGDEEGKKETAAHINNFWEQRMRREFFGHVATGGAGFDPLVMAAAALVRKPKDEAA